MAEHLQLANKFGDDKLKLQSLARSGWPLAVAWMMGLKKKDRRPGCKNPPKPTKLLKPMRQWLDRFIVLRRRHETIDSLGEEASPAEPLANYRKARIHEHLHQTDEAEKEYRKAIAKDAWFLKALSFLGASAVEASGRIDEVLSGMRLRSLHWPQKPGSRAAIELLVTSKRPGPFYVR